MPDICGTRVLGATTYFARTCKTCGIEFQCSSATRYRMQIGGKVCFFCSYSCFREFDKKRRKEDQQKVERQNYYDAVQRGYGWQSKNESYERRESRIQARVDLCEEKRRQWYTSYLLSERGTNRRKKCRDSMRSWERKKADAEKELEEHRKMMGGSKS